MSSENLYQEDYQSPPDVDRYAGKEPVVVDHTSDHELLQKGQQIFKQTDQLQGEVSPREQDEVTKGQELVVTLQEPLSNVCTQGTEGPSSTHIAEESQKDDNTNTTTSTVLMPVYGDSKGHDELRDVSKGWVLNQIEEYDKSHRQEITELTEKVSQMQVKFDDLTEQFQEKSVELGSKQKELDDNRIELQSTKKKVKELEDKLQNESGENETLRMQLEEKTTVVKDREEKIEKLEEEIRRLTDQLEEAKNKNREMYTGAELRDLMEKQHQETREHITQEIQSHYQTDAASSVTSSLSSIQAGHFPYLSGGQPPQDKEQRIHIVSSPPISVNNPESMDKQLFFESSVDRD